MKAGSKNVWQTAPMSPRSSRNWSPRCAKAELATKSPGDYGVDVARRLETLKVVEPSKRQAGIKVGSVDELVERLKGMGIAK